MIKNPIKILPLFFFLAGLLFPIQTVQAAMCSGSSCTGLYADSSCGATGVGTPKYVNGAKIENRQSVIYCKAQWTRANTNLTSKWTAASIRYGGATYVYNQSIQSNGPISYNNVVYTRMIGNDSGVDSINALSCGNASDYSNSLPLGGSTPYTSPYCSNVW